MGSLILLAFCLAALALVAYFDLSTNSVISDEYAHRWTIQHFLAGKGVTLWGFSPNLAFAAVALVPGALGLDPRTWRLAGLPFLVAAGVFLYLSARDLGASRFWAAVAAAAFVCSPITLSVATGMMTETAFVGMEAAAIWLSLRWLRSGTHRWWAVLAIALLPLQRQQGIVIAGTLMLALLVALPRRPFVRKDIVALAAVWIAGGTAVGLTYWLHRHAVSGVGYGSLQYKSVAFALYTIAGLCPILGLFAIPFVAALVRRDPADTLPSWAGKVTVPMAMVGVLFGVAVVVPRLHSIFPGDHVSVTGVGPANLDGKPDLLPTPALIALEVVTVIAFLLVLVWRRRDWSPGHLGVQSRFLILTGAAQFPLVFLNGLVFDRYYLAVLLPMIPLLAAWASRRGSDTPASRWFAVGACLLLLAYFGVGQQDFTEWSNARDRAAAAAFARAASAADVSAGFEEDAEHIWIPAVDHPGAGLPRAVSDHPKLGLVTVPASDPRPGFAYSSVAPGKVIIVYASPSP
jgi:hypothetical protein